MGGSVSTNQKIFKQNWIILIDLTYQPNHPPNHTPNHWWGSLHRFQIFKQYVNNLISSSLLNFYWFWGSPWGWQMGEWGWRWEFHAHTHVHACAHMHAHACFKHDKHGCLHVSHLQFLYMYTCPCMCVHVHMCGDTLPCPQTPPHLLPPQSHREPKTPKFNKSWTNWDNLIVWGFFISKHSWTHIDYSSPTICSPQIPPTYHFYVFHPKKMLLWPSNKNFPVLALDPIRPYLDWTLRGFLTFKTIYNPFKFDLKWRPKCKIQLKCQFALEPSTIKKCVMYP